MNKENSIIAEANNSNQAMQIFNNEKFGEIRTLGDGNNPLFCLPDVCRILDLSNPWKVKADLDDDLTISEVMSDSLGRMQDTTFVNESVLYDIIFSSRKAEAVEFRH